MGTVYIKILKDGEEYYLAPTEDIVDIITQRLTNSGMVVVRTTKEEFDNAVLTTKDKDWSPIAESIGGSILITVK